MYDDTPCEVEELIDHCRALIYAIVTLESQEVKEILNFVLQVKEILNFVLQQQIDLLHNTYQQDLNELLVTA
ncbi:TPA: hypothetical protein SK266_000641 [Yersinia enterocolitica]|nr:hypothetical protein [Yersinia enterocolitica]HEI6862122.1 hypothetical protein [Yersinia enterocolitica]